ncbi:Hok/Gef family protein [Escherichia coli]|nr:Hok/Gef family protein [Escherichia coli]
MSNPGDGKKQVFPAPGFSLQKSGKWREWSVTGNVVLSRRVSEPFWFRQDAGTRNAKTPLVNPLTREACMKYLNTTDCSLFLAERSKFMTKYALIGLLAVCATVLCFSLIFRERLCELNIHRGNTVVQVTLAYEARK